MTDSTSIVEEYLALGETIAQRVALPPVKQVWLPPHVQAPGKGDEFGAVVLADDSVGLVYVQLGATRARLEERRVGETCVGAAPDQLAQGFRSADPAETALALGALNAMGQHVLRRAACPLDTETDSIASFDPQPEDRVGMVGFFPPLVARLRKQDIDLTVLELKSELAREEPRFRVTLDPTALARCNKILCTSTVLLNDSIDAVLRHCGAAARVALIGPSAGFLPDPLFARGVHTVGGAQVIDTPSFFARVTGGRKWGDATRKYVLHHDTYPGAEALLDALG